MIVDFGEWGHESRRTIVTVRCSLCGALKGRDYDRYTWHLYNEHEWSDVVGGED